MRIMALDYGDARTGVAISDALRTLAGQAFVLSSKPENRLLGEIAELARKNQVDCIVVGHPKNMDGTLGEKAAAAEEFAKKIEKETAVKVCLYDERLTTVSASKILHTAGKNAKKQKSNIDAVAAALILESFLLTEKRN